VSTLLYRSCVANCGEGSTDGTTFFGDSSGLKKNKTKKEMLKNKIEKKLVCTSSIVCFMQFVGAAMK